MSIMVYFTYLLVYSFRNTISSENVEIENEMTTTYIFPDATLLKKMNGGFKTQEELKKFVIENQCKHWWNATLHTHPLAKCLAAYEGDTIAQAFPLQFPYGHTGLEEDKAVKLMKELPRNKYHMNCNWLSVMQKFLQHWNPIFYSA